MQRAMAATVLVAGALLGGGMAYWLTPRPVRSLIPDMTPLESWHVSIIGALVVNRETR